MKDTPKSPGLGVLLGETVNVLLEGKVDHDKFEPDRKDSKLPMNNFVTYLEYMGLEAKDKTSKPLRTGFSKEKAIVDGPDELFVKQSKPSHLYSDQDLLYFRIFMTSTSTQFFVATKGQADQIIQEVYFEVASYRPSVKKLGSLAFPDTLTGLMGLAVGRTKARQLLSDVMRRLLETLQLSLGDHGQVARLLARICGYMRLAWTLSYGHIVAETDLLRKDVSVKYVYDTVLENMDACHSYVNYAFPFHTHGLFVMYCDSTANSNYSNLSSHSDSHIVVIYNKSGPKSFGGPWHMEFYAVDWSLGKEKKVFPWSVDVTDSGGQDTADQRTVTLDAKFAWRWEEKIALRRGYIFTDYVDSQRLGGGQSGNAVQRQPRADRPGSSKHSSDCHGKIDKRQSDQPDHRQEDHDPDWKMMVKHAGPQELRQNSSTHNQGSANGDPPTVRIDDRTERVDLREKRSRCRLESQIRSLATHRYEASWLSDKDKNEDGSRDVRGIPCNPEYEVKKSCPHIGTKSNLVKILSEFGLRNIEGRADSLGQQDQTTETALDHANPTDEPQEPTDGSHNGGTLHPNELDSDSVKGVGTLQSSISEAQPEAEIMETTTTSLTDTMSVSVPQPEKEGNDNSHLAVNSEEASSVDVTVFSDQSRFQRGWSDEINVSSSYERTEQGASSCKNTSDAETPGEAETACKDAAILETSSDEETTSVRLITPVQESDLGASGVFTENRGVSLEGSADFYFGRADLPEVLNELNRTDVTTRNITEDGLEAAAPVEDRFKAYNETDDDHSVRKGRRISNDSSADQHHRSTASLRQSATYMHRGTATVQRPSAIAQESSSIVMHRVGQPEGLAYLPRPQVHDPHDTARDSARILRFYGSEHQLHPILTAHFSGSEHQLHPTHFPRSEDITHSLPTTSYSTQSENQLYPTPPRPQLPPVVIHRAGDPPPWATKTPRVDIARAVHPHMVKVLTRRGTYWRKWPENDGRDLNILSLAGFFYTGPGRGVSCWWCGLHLADLKPDQDPWVEHARQSPRCQYLREMRSDEFFKQL